MTPIQSTSKSGFSLLEMMVSFIILSIAMSSIYSALASTLSRASQRMHLYEATELAASLIALNEVIEPDTLAGSSGEYGGKWRWQVRHDQVFAVEIPGLSNTRFNQITVEVFSLGTGEHLTMQRLLTGPEVTN